MPTPQSLGGKLSGWLKFLAWEGGSTFDAFFTCASAQARQRCAPDRPPLRLPSAAAARCII